MPPAKFALIITLRIGAPMVGLLARLPYLKLAPERMFFPVDLVTAYFPQET
jgi:hypothetical protein